MPIVKCDCNSEYQDKRYGKGKRVANARAKSGESRCTVCSKVHGSGGDLKKK